MRIGANCRTGQAGATIAVKFMKLLFSTSDPTRVELVTARLRKANIACKVKESGPQADGLPIYPEVWVHDGDDFEFASAIFANRGSHRVQN